MAQSQTPMTAEPATPVREPVAPSTLARAWRGLWAWLGWHFWVLLAIALTGGLGVYALAQLVRLPGIPECESTLWSLAPAGKRIYCGQSYAERATVEDLLAAIALVDVLETDHPLRAEADERIADWTESILELGEAEFQAGRLENAMEIAERVPTHLESHALVEERVQRWKRLWVRAVAIVDRVQQLSIAAEWQQAYLTAARLPRLPNAYWADKRYGELIEGIRGAREEYGRLGVARSSVSEEASVEELLSALQKLLAIEPRSLFYERARQLTARASQQLVGRGELAVGRGDWSQVLDIAHGLPSERKLRPYRRDFRNLARAGLLAEQGSVPGLESAIDIAESFSPERPLYDRAQQAIGRWEAEIEDIGYLTAARTKARAGTIVSLRAAIAEVRNIPAGNPRYQEAQKEIWSWVTRIQTIEDRPKLDRAIQIARGSSVPAWRQAITVARGIAPRRALHDEAQEFVQQWQVNIQRAEDGPILNRARSLARGNTIYAWQQAIAVANEIAPRRVLYGEAQESVRQWQASIQRTEDAPILNRARSLASDERYAEAIATATRIAAGRALHGEAQGLVGRWQNEIRAERDLVRASEIASESSPWALARAIEIANQIPANTSHSTRSRQEVEEWSRRLLGLARQQSSTSLERAIQIAELVPANSQVYPATREQVTLWRQELAPEPSAEQTLEPVSTPESVAEPAEALQ